MPPRRGWIALAAAALAAAGCGGKSNTTPPSGVTHMTATSAGTRSATVTSAGTRSATASADCAALGIDPSGMREGTCTHAGITWVIVDENHTLTLSTLSAKLAGIRALKTVTGDRTLATAPGKFVIASITITNRLQAPQTFDRAHTQQAGLILAGAVFKEDVRAESRSGAGSCLEHSGAPIQPSRSVTCDVIFDVPASAAADLGKHGSGDLWLVNFGSDLTGTVVPGTIGQIRLYR